MPKIGEISLVDGPASELADPTPTITPSGTLGPVAATAHLNIIQSASIQQGRLVLLGDSVSGELSGLNTQAALLLDADNALPGAALGSEISTLIARENARGRVDQKVRDLIAADPTNFTGPTVVFETTQLDAQRLPFQEGLQGWEEAFPLFPFFIG